MRERVARLRKEWGFTQVALAEKVGIIQTIVSAIETNVLKLSAEMAVRFAMALEVSTDDLLQPSGPKPARKASRKVIRKVIRRLEQNRKATVSPRLSPGRFCAREAYSVPYFEVANSRSD